MGWESAPNLFLSSLIKLMPFLQMPNLLHRIVLHLNSQPEVDLAPGRHVLLATGNISNERKAYNLPLCPGEGQELGTPLWEDYQPLISDGPFKCFIWTASSQLRTSSFSQSGQTDPWWVSELSCQSHFWLLFLDTYECYCQLNSLNNWLWRGFL